MSLRIALFYKHLLAAGGAERLVLRELDHLRGFGHEVRLLAYRVAAPALFGRAPLGDGDIVEVGGRAPTAFLRAARWLAGFRPDWILSSSGHIDAWGLARLAGTRYALHVHHPLFLSLTDRDKYARRYRRVFDELAGTSPFGDDFGRTDRSLSVGERVRLEVRAAMHHRAVLGARRVLVLSEHARGEKRLLYGIDADVLRGALEGRDPGDADRGAARRALDLTHARPVVFAVARLAAGKRIDLLVRAFGDVLAEDPAALLAIGGTGPDEARLRELVRAEGLGDRVRFLGYLDEERLGLWYQAADVFASLEGADFNLTPLEALERATPALVSVETDLGEALPGSGWLEAVAPTRDAVRAGLLRLLSRREGLAVDRLRPALEPFHWERYFRGVEAVLLDEDRPDSRGAGTTHAARGPGTRP